MAAPTVLRFANFQQFQNHIQKAQVAGSQAIGGALYVVALRVLQGARDMIGKYHRSVGPYPKWDQLSIFTQANRAMLGFTVNDPLLRTGTLRDSYEAVMIGPYAAGVGSPLGAALGHEVGVPNNPIPNMGPIPPRPVLGPVVYRDQKKLINKAGSVWYNAIFFARYRKSASSMTFTNMDHFAEEAE
jgi:hypothetical protein